MKRIKISEEQDRIISQLVLEDVSEMLDVNSGMTNTLAGAKSKNSINISGDMPNGKKMPMSKVLDVAKSMNTGDSEVTASGTVPVEGGGEAYGKMTIQKKPANESFIISKGQLNRLRLRKLKENSSVIKVKDFIN